jgi:hypothetical protein
LHGTNKSKEAKEVKTNEPISGFSYFTSSLFFMAVIIFLVQTYWQNRKAVI